MKDIHTTERNQFFEFIRYRASAVTSVTPGMKKYDQLIDVIETTLRSSLIFIHIIRDEG